MGDTTMQHTINITSITQSLHKQLINFGQPIELNQLSKITLESFTGFESNYDEIKASNHKMHRQLSDFVKIKLTVLLDMTSRALGYENHHSLKHLSMRQQSKRPILTFMGSDHLLAKFLMARQQIKEYMANHGLVADGFHLTGGKKEVSFMFHAPGKRYTRSTLQKETNIFLKSLGFSPYKNTIQFPIAYRTLDVQPAVEIIKQYNILFKPVWIEDPSLPGGYDVIDRGSILPITFEKIYDTGKGLLRVNDYTTDLVFNIVSDALDFAFEFGTDDICIDMIQILINIPKRQRVSYDSVGISMATLSAIENKYESDIIRSIAAATLDEVIQKHKDRTFLFRLDGRQVPFIYFIEKYVGKKIGVIMREMINNAIEKNIVILRTGSKFRFDFDASIDGVCQRLCGLTHQQLLDRDNEMWHHDMRKTIQHIVSEVIEHIELVQEAIIKR